MVHLHIIDEQLREIGVSIKFFGRPEVRELAKILGSDETIMHAVNGYYENGFALLVATDQRLLLIDRKPMSLTVEDIQFETVTEVGFTYRLFNAMVRIHTPHKSLVFSCWNGRKLRELSEYLQKQVLQNHQQEQDEYTQQERFRALAQAQLQNAAAQHATPRRRFSPSLLPALASTAFLGFSKKVATSVPMSRFSTAEKNPNTKTPLLSRRRRFPFL